MLISKVAIFYRLLALYAIFAVALSIALKFIGDDFRRRGRAKACRNTRIIIVLVFLPLILYVTMMGYATYIEPNWLQVKVVDIRDSRLSVVLRDVRIVQLSDFHVERVGLLERRLIAAIRRLKPDLIFITGDFINAPSGVEPALSVLRQLKAKYGVYAVLGNTDYYFVNEGHFVGLLREAGVTTLLHENLKLDLDGKRSLRLVGLSYRYDAQVRYGQTSMLERAFEGVLPDEPVIVLTHNPDLIEVPELVAYKPDLVLAGHTHGGQFGIPFIRKYSYYAQRSKFMAGLFRVSDMWLYVNRGLGMKTRRIRFFCRPEVTVFNFHGEDMKKNLE